MDINAICDSIIDSSKHILATHIKSELEKIKIRDLKELGADSHYNYTVISADTSMDANDPLLKNKPADIHVIFRMVTPQYMNQTVRKKVIKKRISQSIWYITDRGLTIERYTSYIDDAVFLQYVRYNHRLCREDDNKTITMKSHKTDESSLWITLSRINNSMPPLPRHFYNIFANNMLSQLCMQFNPYNIDMSINTIPVYLAEIARNAAKSPHIDELLLSNSITVENEKILALIEQKKAELDKYYEKIIAECEDINPNPSKKIKL